MTSAIPDAMPYENAVVLPLALATVQMISAPMALSGHIVRPHIFGFARIVPVILWLGRYDRRLLGGVKVWSKPFKFALSLAIHFATFAMAPFSQRANARSRP